MGIVFYNQWHNTKGQDADFTIIEIHGKDEIVDDINVQTLILGFMGFGVVISRVKPILV